MGATSQEALISKSNPLRTRSRRPEKERQTSAVFEDRPAPTGGLIEVFRHRLGIDAVRCSDHGGGDPVIADSSLIGIACTNAAGFDVGRSMSVP